jgi:hypothetical protein
MEDWILDVQHKGTTKKKKKKLIIVSMDQQRLLSEYL